MKRLNYILVPPIAILLISNVFLYYNLSKQNSSIKKDISDLKQEQISQQASQKEAMENLQNLVTFNWKTYQNDKFGFSFKYPEYMNICNETAKYNIELSLVVHQGICDKENFNEPLAQIRIIKNINNYKTAEGAFYGEERFSTKSLNPQLNSFKIDNFDAYGGKVIYEIREAGKKYTVATDFVILKSNYIIELVGNAYIETKNNGRIGNKSVLDSIIFSSLHFY